MIHFTSLENAGLRVAVMSDKRDGDCGALPEAQATARAFLDRAGVSAENVVRLRQVHGTRVVDGRTALGRQEEADGVATDSAGVALGIAVADCAPVLLYDPVAGALAALHAGREGTLKNIVAEGVGALCSRYHCTPSSILAAVGPCAGQCCYEVSPEHARRWREAGLPLAGRNLDLQGANCLQLENAGVIRHNTTVAPHCTVCGGLFFSYRAGEISNRNLVMVML